MRGYEKFYRSTVRIFFLIFNNHKNLGIGNILSNKNNAEFWNTKEVSEFIKSIPGCESLNNLFENEVRLFINI